MSPICTRSGVALRVGRKSVCAVRVLVKIFGRTCEDLQGRKGGEGPVEILRSDQFAFENTKLIYIMPPVW